MNPYEEEIVTAQYADDPNELLPPSDSNSSGLSPGCILSIVAGAGCLLLLGVVVVAVSFFVWSSKRQNQAVVAGGPVVTAESLNESNLADAVEVFAGADRAAQVEIESHPDFKGIHRLFEKCAEVSDWDDTEAVYPFFDFKKHAQEVSNVPETKYFFQGYAQREVERAVRNFGVYIPPFGKWEFAEIQQLSSNDRLVYVQVQLSYDVAVKRCRVWVTKNRFAGWKIYDWEEISSLSRASSEAALLIAEPNTTYIDAFNKYYELLETDFVAASSNAEYDRILRKCEGLKLNPKIRPSVLLNVAEYWSSIDKPKEALRCVDKIKNKDLIPEVYRLEGNAYEALEDYESAVEKYELFGEQVGFHSDVLGEVLEFHQDDPEKLFNAIAGSSQSDEVYRNFFEHLAGNPFALPELRLVKEYVGKSDLGESLLGQRAAAWLAMAQGNRDGFQRLMVEIFEQDSDTDIDQKWIEAIEYGYYRKLFDAAPDKKSAFEAMARVYLFDDWYGSEADFESICDASFDLMPKNRYAIYFKAYQFFEAGEFGKALPLFKAIDGEMDGDFEYLNASITTWRLKGLLHQKQFSKALELAKQKDSVEELLQVAIQQDLPELFDMISDKDLGEPARLLLKGVRALENNQHKSAARHFSNLLKREKTPYVLVNAAMAGLVKSKSKTPALEIFKLNSTYQVYRYLVEILKQNKDWRAAETLSRAALKLLKPEFKDDTYVEGYVLRTLIEAQWHQQKYGSILKRYKALGDKQELGATRFVLWAACKASDFGLARQVCEKKSADYNSGSNMVLVAAFEGDVQAFSAASKELTPYYRASLANTMIRLGVDDKFRRLLYRDLNAVNIGYWDSNSESIDAVFAADWRITDAQIQSALVKFSEAVGEKFEIVKTPMPKEGQTKLWAAKSSSYGVMIEVKQTSGRHISGGAGSAVSRRIKDKFADNHQQMTLTAFPITGHKASLKSPNNKSKSVQVRQGSSDYEQLVASLLVSIADHSPLALQIGGSWSDDELVFERIKAIAEGEAYRRLAVSDTFYGYSFDTSEGDVGFAKLGFQKDLAQAFQQFQDSSDSKKEFSVTVEYNNVSIERIELKLNQKFEALTFTQGAKFIGVVTKQSEPFGIFQAGDRLEFTDDLIDQWELKLDGKVQSARRGKK